MANEEVLGSRKTMFVLVIVVGCFAVLWPRILGPLLLGPAALKPGQLDRDAGCCEVIFESEVAVLELVNEVCNSAVGSDGKLSPYAANECRKAVNETCGLDIAEFLKRSDNMGKTMKALLQTMKQSNSSCLKEHFGVPVWILGAHTALNSWTQQDTMKQERPPIRGAGPHPALRERGRAIPVGAPTPPSRGPVPMPPHARVRSPLSVYFKNELDFQVLCALLFYAHGSYQRITGKANHFSQEAMSVYIQEVTTALNHPNILRRFIKFPTTQHERDAIKQCFYNKYRIPGVIGCIDCSHFRIFTPHKEEEHLYFCRKHYHSMNVQMPPPIPGMRPPLGSPGGPVPAPKSSMGFVMPIYTICIIVFFVYTLSKILFKRTGSVPYEHVAPDPQFRRRVFRDDSRSSPETKLGHKERDAIVTAISGLVAEVHQQMEANYAQSQQRQEAQENQNHTRPYTNGSVLKSSPIIVASEIVEHKEKSPEPEKPKEASPEPEEAKEASSEPEKPKEASPESEEAKEASPEPEKSKEASPEPEKPKEASPEPEQAKEPSPQLGRRRFEKSLSPERSLEKEPAPSPDKSSPEKDLTPEEASPEKSPEESPEKEIPANNEPEEQTGSVEDDLLKLTEDIKEKKENLAKSTEEFLNDVRKKEEETVELLKEALKEDPADEEDEDETDEPEQDNVSVKVVGMELSAGGAPPPPPPPRAHEVEEVKSIFLETRIPQQSRVLVAEFEDEAAPAPRRRDPMVVSGKMTLSLIQDAPRDTPERDLESTVEDFTTASGITQPIAEKEGESSGEEIEEEIEVEEIEEEEEEDKPQPKIKQ